MTKTERSPETLLQLAIGLTALVALAVFVSGCSVSHDRMGNPNGIGFFLAASEQPTDAQRAGQFIEDASQEIAPWLPEPWGKLLTLGAGVVGAGVLGARARRREDAAFDEGVSRAAPSVAPAVQPMSASRVGPIS